MTEKTAEEYGVFTDPGTLRLERFLPGPIELVWEYLTESEKRGKWLARGEMELRIGGEVELNFNHAELTAHPDTTPEEYKDEECASVHGRITRLAPPSLLSYTWEWGDELTEVTFELSPQGDKTELILTHRLISKRGQMISIAAGWHTHVGILIDKLNGDEPMPFWKTHAELEKVYEAKLSVNGPN